MLTSDYISIGSLFVSAVAIFYTYFSNTKKYELTSLYRNQVIYWFEETTKVLIALKLESQNGFQNEDYKRELLCKLSTKIEVGRFYFPNINLGNDFGSEKPFAYQGYRNLVLDFLVYSYRLYEKPDAVSFLNHAEVLQRYFTSYIYEIINPVKFLKETKKYTNKKFSKDLTFEDFISEQPELIRNYI